MSKRLQRTLGLAVVIFSGLSVFAQVTNVEPTVIQQEDVLNSTLFYKFQDANAVVKGSLRYAGSNGAGNRFFGFVNNASDYLAFFSANHTRFYAPSSTLQMRIDGDGVKIGTNAAETAVRLVVNGAIDVKAGIAAQYQDVAEWVPAVGDPTPGTVVVLDQNTNNTVIASASPYDTRVAGVVSPQPGLILGIPGEDKVMVATTGRVKVRVDATSAPIEIGDLLVTSDKLGVAMKSIPVDIAGIAIHRPGTVVGKALEPLAGGTGEILVLLSMQ